MKHYSHVTAREVGGQWDEMEMAREKNRFSGSLWKAYEVQSPFTVATGIFISENVQ
jgi:hypothetical protein